MKSREAAPLKKIIKNVLGNTKSIKYLHGLDFAYIDSMDIYQAALSNLLNSQTEKAIKAILFGLDLDRDNNSILHLAKTMLFSLSEDFYENDGAMFKQKYSNLEKAKNQLEQKIRKLQNELSQAENEFNLLDNELESLKKKFFLFSFFKKKKCAEQLENQRIKITSIRSDLGLLEDEHAQLASLAKIEEYMKVLGVVLEVCIFPMRFEWVMN